MSLSPYPQYEDSGLKWLGMVPSDWGVGRLKNVLAQKITDGPHTTPIFTDEGISFLSVDGIQDGELRFDSCRYISQADHADFSRKASPQLNDILMGKAASTGKIARVKVPFEFSIWSPLALIRVDQSRCIPRFAEYWLKGSIAQAQIDTLCTNNTQKNISMDDIPKIDMLFPPATHQIAVADFLDHQTAEIDAFITDQEELIALLAERRTATITHAVTKGLNPDAQMTDTGIDFLREIPESWDVLPFLHTMSSRVDFRGATPNKVDSEIPLVTAKNVRAGYIDYEISKEFIAEDTYSEVMRRGLPQLGDILLTMEAPLGNVALVDVEYVALAQRVVKFRPTDSTLSQFALYAMNSPYFQAQLTARSTGSTALGIKASKLHELKLAIPEISIQRQIAEYLDNQISQVDTMIADALETIALSAERRAALISAAVTGKIDVRGQGATASMGEAVSVGVA